jgi:hypothetical protein
MALFIDTVSKPGLIVDVDDVVLGNAPPSELIRALVVDSNESFVKVFEGDVLNPFAELPCVLTDGRFMVLVEDPVESTDGRGENGEDR